MATILALCRAESTALRSSIQNFVRFVHTKQILVINSAHISTYIYIYEDLFTFLKWVFNKGLCTLYLYMWLWRLDIVWINKTQETVCINVRSFTSFIINIKCLFNNLWPCSVIVKLTWARRNRDDRIVNYRATWGYIIVKLLFRIPFKNIQIITYNSSDFLIFGSFCSDVSRLY